MTIFYISQLCEYGVSAEFTTTTQLYDYVSWNCVPHIKY